MKTIPNTQWVSTTILTTGILNSLLGAIHLVGTFTFERRTVAGQGTALLQRDYLVWFGVTGGYILFLGLIHVLCASGLKANAKLAWRIALLCAAFTTVTGLGGVILFGVSPPLVLLATGLVALCALAVSRSRCQAG